MAAMDGDDAIIGQAGSGLGEQRFVVRVDRHHHAPDARIGEEGFQRVTQHRLAADLAILLRSFDGLPRALAASCGDDDGGDLTGPAGRQAIGLCHLLVHSADA